MKYGTCKYGTVKYGKYTISDTIKVANKNNNIKLRLKSKNGIVNMSNVTINRNINLLKMNNTYCIPITIDNCDSNFIRIKNMDGNVLSLCMIIKQ